jgi:hypothetical protein
MARHFFAPLVPLRGKTDVAIRFPVLTASPKLVAFRGASFA